MSKCFLQWRLMGEVQRVGMCSVLYSLLTTGLDISVSAVVILAEGNANVHSTSSVPHVLSC